MPTFRILWTREGTVGGWYADVDAPDEQTAAWSQAVQATAASPDSQHYPVLIGLQAVTPPAE